MHKHKHKHKHNHRKGLGLCFSASNKPATHPTTDRLVACGEARERDKSQVQEWYWWDQGLPLYKTTDNVTFIPLPRPANWVPHTTFIIAAFHL